jgi:hypothetical protein
MVMPMMVLRKLKTVLFYDNEDGKNQFFRHSLRFDKKINSSL